MWLHPERSVARLLGKVQLLLWGRGRPATPLVRGGSLSQPSSAQEDKDPGPLAFGPALPCGWRRAIYPSWPKSEWDRIPHLLFSLLDP